MGSTHGPEEAASRLLELISKFLEDRTAEISTLLTFNEQQGNAPPLSRDSLVQLWVLLPVPLSRH